MRVSRSRREINQGSSQLAAMIELSIVIPVLNEANHLAELLPTLRQVNGIEVIVVDGGSEDDSRAVAIAAGVQVLDSPKGRARQMNCGAAIARSERLLFLHADTRLPDQFQTAVQQALAQPQVIAGAFDLRIDDPRPWFRLLEWAVYWRSRLWQMPYGDQALFFSRPAFLELGGFPDLPIMEDFTIVRQIQRLGKLVIIPQPVITSARRWQKLGVLQTTLLNQIIVLAYLAGWPPEQLRQWYDHWRSSRSGVRGHNRAKLQ